MDPMSGWNIRLVFTSPSETVHRSTQDAHTFEITFFALHLCYNLQRHQCPRGVNMDFLEGGDFRKKMFPPPPQNKVNLFIMYI